MSATGGTVLDWQHEGPTNLWEKDSTSAKLPAFSVSGQSAGGSMAVQMLFSFSSRVVGAAVAAGSPYGCGSLLRPWQACYGTIKPDVERLVAYTHERHWAGLIDAPHNLAKTPILLFNGQNDYVVQLPCMRGLLEQLSHFTDAPFVTANFATNAGHVWSVDHGECKCGACGGGGGSAATSYTYGSYTYDGDDDHSECCDVNNCKYDLSGALLHHIYGSSTIEPRTTPAPTLHWIRQSRYFPRAAVGEACAEGVGSAPSDSSSGRDGSNGSMHGWRRELGACSTPEVRRVRNTLRPWAMAYVPTTCRGSAASSCRVHVNFHGCMVSARTSE